MLPKHIEIEQPSRSVLLASLGGYVEAVAITASAAALVCLLSYGGVFLSLTFGPAPANVDQPLPDPFDDRAMMADSAVVLLGCAVVVAIGEFRRRKRRGTR